VLRVPLLVQRDHSAARDRLLATGTDGTRDLVVVQLAVGLALILVEWSGAESLVAVAAAESRIRYLLKLEQQTNTVSGQSQPQSRALGHKRQRKGTQRAYTKCSGCHC
jgi:anti-sigma-K factor RskA